MKDIIKAINNNTAEFIGEGVWVKDSCWQIYKLDDKYYAIIMYDSQSKWLEEESIKEINEIEISDYI